MEPEPQQPQSTEQTPYEPSTGASSTSDDTQMAMLTHLSGIILGFIVPLIVWLINKDKPEKDFLIDQSKEALNFQITVAIAYIAARILSGIIPAIGFLFLAVWIVNIVFCIMAGMAANRGERFRYPYTLRLIS